MARKRRKWTAADRKAHGEKIRAAMEKKRSIDTYALAPIKEQGQPIRFPSHISGGAGGKSNAFQSDEQRIDPLTAIVQLYSKGLIDAPRAMEIVRCLATKP